MDAGGRQHADATVPVLIVVPVEVTATKADRILDGTEPFRKLRAVFQRLELRLRVRVIVGNVRPAEASRDLQIDEELPHRLGNHGASAVRMQRQIPRLDALPEVGFVMEIPRDVVVLLGLNRPTNHQAAEQIDGDVELEAGAADRPLEVGDVPGPDLVGRSGAQLGFHVRRMDGLAAALLDFLRIIQDPVHGPGGTKVDAPVGQGGRDRSRGAVDELFRMAYRQNLLAFLLGQGPLGLGAGAWLTFRLELPVVGGPGHSHGLAGRLGIDRHGHFPGRSYSLSSLSN